MRLTPDHMNNYPDKKVRELFAENKRLKARVAELEPLEEKLQEIGKMLVAMDILTINLNESLTYAKNNLIDMSKGNHFISEMCKDIKRKYNDE